MLASLNTLLDEAEQLYSNPDYIKCKDRFYDIIELCVEVRPVSRAPTIFLEISARELETFLTFSVIYSVFSLLLLFTCNGISPLINHEETLFFGIDSPNTYS